MARKIKFALEMKDGAKVRSNLEELRENFDLEKAVGHFLSGKLIEWLEDRYYEDEAEALRAIGTDAPDLRERLCAVLGVAYEASDEDLDVEQLARLNEKKAVLRQKTSDEEIIANADKTALTQEDLADLLDMDAPVIYLCGDSFNIPARVTNKKYIGILGTPTISINASSQEEADEKGIVFENVKLPWAMEIQIQKSLIEHKNEDSGNFTGQKITDSLINDLREIYKSTFNDDHVWTIIDKNGSKDYEITSGKKKIAMKILLHEEYTENDIVHVTIRDDFSSGWAFTRDSVCICTFSYGHRKIMYTDIKDIINGSTISDSFFDFSGPKRSGYIIHLKHGDSICMDNQELKEMQIWEYDDEFKNYLNAVAKF